MDISTAVLVKPSNLFVNGYIVNFTEDNESVLLRDLLVIEPNVNDNYHTVVNDDRLDLIAYAAYNKQVEDAAKYWWIIADANNIFNPFDLDYLIGQDIVIPDIDKVKLLL